MKEWTGTAAVCLNEHHQLLMVQGEDGTDWAVPSGGLEPGETLRECCIREVREETGYEVEVVGELYVKRKQTASGIRVETYYFEVRVTGGELRIADPDGIVTLENAGRSERLQSRLPGRSRIFDRLYNVEAAAGTVSRTYARGAVSSSPYALAISAAPSEGYCRGRPFLRLSTEAASRRRFGAVRQAFLPPRSGRPSERISGRLGSRPTCDGRRRCM